MSDKLFRLPAVSEQTGLPKATIYFLIKRGQFPSPVKLVPGGRAVAWRERDINDFIESREPASGKEVSA